jgi:hypothetical protein
MFAGKWMELETTVLSEISKTIHMFSYTESRS